MKFLVVLSWSVFSIFNVLAEQFEPARVGNIFEPQITTAVQYDDNIYTSKSETVSSFIYYFIPSITFSLEEGSNRYGGEYILSSSFYSSGKSESDNMTDAQLSLFANNEFTSKHRTSIDFSYENLHEKRGSGLTESYLERGIELLPRAIDYNQLTSRFYYQFGGRYAKMRIGTGVSYYDRQYNSYTDITKYSDLDRVTFSADADYEIGKVTYLTFDIFTTDVSYTHRNNDQAIQDNQDTHILVGLTWRGSAIINGRARIGYQYKKFDEIEEADFNGNTVDLMINWSPKERDVYSVNLSRVSEDSYTVGNYIKNLTGSLGWRHQWTGKFDSNVQFEYSDEDYVGADREDKTTNMKAELIYGFSRWLNLSAGLEHTVSRSNEDTIGYKQNIFTLSVKASL